MAHGFPALIAAPAAGEGRLWLTNVRLFDGTGGAAARACGDPVGNGIIRRVTDAAEPGPTALACWTWASASSCLG